MIYQSPCHPCDYNHYSVDEFGECVEDICKCPEKEINDKCWIVQWAKEMDQKGGHNNDGSYQ